ncbi:MAG TPA: alkaline phosphatase D family protein [Chitinophagales bacterium]|nr:alkaline phosphatase D family protein [Chitinophagales bacterium]
MRLGILLITCIVAFSANAQTLNTSKLISRIGFGSCNSQDNAQVIWDTIIKYKPECFILLGDNIYGDKRDMQVLLQKYNKFGSKAPYQRFKQKCPVIATWDDHDYGVNDGGKEYSMKKESKEIFLNFFNEPKDSERRKHEGIYTSYMIEQDGKRLQIILPDLRTFRDSICRGGTDEDCYGEYIPCTDPAKTMLGEAQWKWLEGELRKPADLRIIGSSTQFLVDFNGWEAWANLPYERERFLKLIADTKANGVVFISGDLHYAELSRLHRPDLGLYPIYDLTSSGMTHGHSCAGENKNRIHGAYMKANFGMINIDWRAQMFVMEIKDEKGDAKITHTIPFSELRF